MATLKSIKNKYLQASDGDDLGVSTNTENISLLSFKLATADSLTKFNLVDGFADDYNDATGVDTGTSSDIKRDATSNYYVGHSSPSGGTVTTWGTYTVHSFLSSGTFILPASQIMVDCLVIGGGGGGGGVFVTPGGGGGGAGGWVYNSTYTMAAGSHTITIGTGGAGSTNADTKGVNGVDTTVGSLLTAKGGGGGGQYGGAGPDNKPGSDGGSGGGGSWTPGPGGSETQTGQPGDSGAPAGFGNDGGSGANEPAGKGGAGGGGAGAAGQDMQSGGAAGTGGVGKSTTMVDNTTRFFAGGGGGGEGDTGSGQAAGGNGGGGPGGTESGGAYNGVAGTANTGGGGGGGGTNSSGQDGYGGNGGSGVVYFRYTTAGSGGVADMTLQSNTFTAQTAPTTARIILDEESYAGTTTLNTDIKAYASRDGTNFTQVTLASQADLTQYTKLLLHCDGTNGGTTFTDSSPSGHTVTAQGATHTDTTIKKFGTASAQFGGDGTGDDLTIPDSADWDIGTGDFTFDCWVYPTDNGSSYRKILASGAWGGTTNEYDWVFDKTDAEKLRLQLYDGTSAPAAISTGTIANDTWTHVAAVRKGSTVTLYINGTADGTMSSSVNIMSHGALQVGRQVAVSSTAQMWQGYIDELRVSKGIARWDANFTPDTSPYGATDGDRRLLSGSVDISGQPSGTNMKYKIETLNQAVAKQTRVYGTSMAWA